MSVTKVKAKTEGQVKETEFKESDDLGEKGVAMEGGVVAKVVVQSMKLKGRSREVEFLSRVWLGHHFLWRGPLCGTPTVGPRLRLTLFSHSGVTDGRNNGGERKVFAGAQESEKRTLRVGSSKAQTGLCGMAKQRMVEDIGALREEDGDLV